MLSNLGTFVCYGGIDLWSLFSFAWCVFSHLGVMIRHWSDQSFWGPEGDMAWLSLRRHDQTVSLETWPGCLSGDMTTLSLWIWLSGSSTFWYRNFDVSTGFKLSPLLLPSEAFLSNSLPGVFSWLNLIWLSVLGHGVFALQHNKHIVIINTLGFN